MSNDSNNGRNGADRRDAPRDDPTPYPRCSGPSWANDPLVRPQYRGRVTETGLPRWVQTMEVLCWVIPGSIRQGHCLWCGERFERESDCCSEQCLRDWRRWLRRRKRKVRRCGHCRCHLPPETKPTTRYCSGSCRQAAYRGRATPINKQRPGLSRGVTP